MRKTDNSRGLFIVVVGPDGSGKSTVTRECLSNIGNAFREHVQFHWRPGFLPSLSVNKRSQDNEGGVVAPPRNYKYGWLVSLMRFIYYWVDFWAGYWLVIFSRRNSGVLVVGERWYYDVMVDPVRYGFKLPSWVFKVASLAVPNPDAVFLFRANPASIRIRKPELDTDEIIRQYRSYEEMFARCRHVISISTDISVQESVREMTRAICSCREQRK